MAKFMLILHDDPSTYRDVTPAQMQEILQQYLAWTERITKEGRLVHCEKLRDEGGRRIRKQGAGLVVVDGPYAEAKEVVGGYYMIEAKGYADAVEVAKTCPHAHLGGTIDVREVDELTGS